MANPLIFCAACQERKEHSYTRDANREYVFTCSCGRFIKARADITPDELRAMLDEHESGATGQVPADVAQAAIDADLTEGDDVVKQAFGL